MTPPTTSPPRTHIQAIAILYEDTSEQLTTLAGIEQAVRNQMQKHVMPEVGVFCHSSYRHKRRTPAHLKSILGELPLTNQQAQHLGAPTHNWVRI